ncbi:MAG: hypothetical protein DMF53_22935 [Acidobacteria bacterium]|nr:MAG: hypothetical protein DMF53_22935 [Acidobacteriota bacterium]
MLRAQERAHSALWGDGTIPARDGTIPKRARTSLKRARTIPKRGAPSESPLVDRTSRAVP